VAGEPELIGLYQQHFLSDILGTVSPVPRGKLRWLEMS
jgi:hypothetical protein